MQLGINKLDIGREWMDTGTAMHPSPESIDEYHDDENVLPGCVLSR